MKTTITPEVTVDLEVYCRDCGENLSVEVGSGSTALEVTPCPICLKRERGEAYDKG